MRVECNRIVRDDTVRARLEADLCLVDSLRTVIDLRDLFECTRKILRRDLARRRKFES